MNTRHDVLYWFEPSLGVIALHPILMYYAIKIDSSLFFRYLLGVFSRIFRIVSDVDLSFLFIVGELPHIV
jgi:hypothetical protein